MTSTAHDGCYPASFFEDSPSKRALPFTHLNPQHRSTVGKATYLARGMEGLPANPGDLLWLIDRFFQEAIQKEEVDLISPSIHPHSVYRLITAFCAKGTYKHHPHLRTFLAFANMAEMGMDEQKVSSNALMLAAEVLRGPFAINKKTANITVNKVRRSALRSVLTIGQHNLPNTIAEGDEPELERDVEVLSDITDIEDNEDDDDDTTAGRGQQGTKRGRGGGEDDDGRRSRKSAGKAVKGGDDEMDLDE
jgi:hypothetical protein